MSLEDLRGELPAYAKDLKLNLGSLANETVLDDQKKWGAYLASAHGAANPAVVKAIESEVADKLSEEAAEAARAAAAIMGMNNVYYRFTHLASNKDYRNLPAKLRMNIIGKPGVEKADFELWSLAVSAINGCGMCVDSHEAELKKAGVTTEQIQAAVRIASVVNAVSKVMQAEEGR
ncbi:MAG: carboxymuconolactone decarboxylase family protein [Euryhalocaulis sp.]|uniref:carboxymuconolactone decarboxylase family protein n=1 Tax=Euryhalocaulis sp. TaxID=2744307 RepID=UPI0017E6B2F3|nr:carboxymuconolactone decarboxylase family protein [Euryhalocaulis sp.]MBA4801776.1 carboxymuconolactone decarboxylase family protein [Euryhalocaulis sp.]